MEFQRVDKKAKTKWRFSRIIALIFAVIPAAVAVLLVFSAIAEDEGSRMPMMIGWIIAGILVLIQLLSIFIYPPIEYIQWAYLIAPDRIEIKKGISPTKPTKNFSVLDKYKMPVMRGMVIDNTDAVRAINDNAFCFPVSLLGI